MTQRELAHTLFPLGAMRKSETRAVAETQGFGNARKRDSQDICFAPDGDYAAAIGRLTGEKSVPGAFVSTDGRVLGEHKGIIHYTVGQRRGLGISHGERLYVCGSIRRETRSSSAKRRTCTGAKRRYRT